MILGAAALYFAGPAWAVDQAKVQLMCKQAYPADRQARERCVTAEAVAAAEMEGLEASAQADVQRQALAGCRRRSPASYAGQVQCIVAVLDALEIAQTCEQVRQNSGGSYQVKEACIKAETDAKKRLQGQ